MKRALKIMFVFLSFSFVIQSQTKIKLRGDRAYNKKDYVSAIEAYTGISENENLNETQLLNLANSYYNIRDYKNASKKYMNYVRKGNSLSLSKYNQYLQSLKLSNYYNPAIIEEITPWLEKLPKSILKRYNFLQEENKRQEIFSSITSSYKLKNLNINSTNSDFGIFIFPDATVMFSSSRENETYSNIYKKIKQPFINIYKSKLRINNSIDNSTIEKYIEKSMLHSSSPFYDTLFNRLFYTQSETENNKIKFNKTKNNFRIVYGVLDAKKQIGKAYYYPEESNDYSYGHPFFDKETKRLYFVSDMPGGFGGTDIYYVEMNAEGVTSDPINLGEKVNSFANEMFPSISNDQLYFSSNLFIGKGGLDVYSSKINGDEFEYPLLLEGSINSIADDFAYQIVETNKNEQKGYISSNRKGGKGSDDIYSFTQNKSIKEIKVTGFTKQIGKDSIIIPNATIEISTLKGTLIKTISTDTLGMYTVFLRIDNNYLFKAEKEDFTGASDTISLTNINNTNPITKDFYLKKELIIDLNGNLKINLEPVSFKYDSAEVTSKGEKQLQFVINYLIKHPTDKIKLEAHTDASGGNAYNLALSKKRANSVQDYLLSKGIAYYRIVSVQGYGETQLINDCKNYRQCSDEENKKNRRTDFIIVPNN